MNWSEIIDLHYPADREVRAILLKHSHSVANLALEIAHRMHLPLDDGEIMAAAMLHDVGIIFTDAPSIDCHGSAPYIAHGPIGADLLRNDGIDEKIALVAERHTASGLTADEIAAASLPLPPGRCYMPLSLLEKLICYADCFYSKGDNMQRKDIDRVRKSMARFGAEIAKRFEDLHEIFGNKT